MTGFVVQKLSSAVGVPRAYLSPSFSSLYGRHVRRGESI